MKIGETNNNELKVILGQCKKEWRSNHTHGRLGIVQCEKCEICYCVNSCDFRFRKCPKCHGREDCSRKGCPNGKYDCDECRAYIER